MKIQIYIFALLVLVLPSCEDFLKEEPASTIAPENFFKSEADAKAALIAAYNILGTENRTPHYRKYYNFATFILSDVSTDVLTAGSSSRAEVHRYVFTPSNIHFSFFWEAAYIGINRANVVLDNVPAIEMDETLKNRILGEAHFLRALHYFNLVRYFGGVPIKTSQTTSVLKDLEIPRASVAEVYKVIIDDLEFAKVNLPAESDISLTEKGRASNGAATTLLAKVYLTQEDWPLAAVNCLDVINSQEYELFEDYQNLWKIENQNGKEHIFSRQAKGFVAGSLYQPFFTGGGSGIGPDGGYGSLKVVPEFYQTFEPSYRRQVSFITEWTFEDGRNIQLNPPNNWKYYNPAAPLPATFAGAGAEDGDNNMPILRYADVLMMYAEALNEQGKTDEALPFINMVKARARGEGTPYETALPADLAGLNQGDLRKAIQQERAWELCYENHRWFDLVRTDMLIETMATLGIVVKPTQTLFPIPQREMDINSALVQNPGYN